MTFTDEDGVVWSDENLQELIKTHKLLKEALNRISYY